MERRTLALKIVSDHPSTGTLSVVHRTKIEAILHGGRKALKIVGVFLLCHVPLAMIEPFLFLIWGSISIGAILLFIGPLLHLKYAGELETFEFAHAACPTCQKETRLTPYTSAHLKAEITLLCPECGQTCRGIVEAIQT